VEIGRISNRTEGNGLIFLTMHFSEVEMENQGRLAAFCGGKNPNLLGVRDGREGCMDGMVICLGS